MAQDAVLYIDTCADLPADVVAGLGVSVFNFPYVLEGEQRADDFGCSQSHADFYGAMRAGHCPTTMQIPAHVFAQTFMRHAEAGEPLLYLAFTAALSGTFDVAWLARQQVLERYPGAEIRLVDTRAASVAEGLLVYEAARLFGEGMPIAEIEAWVEAQRPRLNGWFIVDDLESLRRGGRLPAAAAAAGTLLDVKPLLCVGDSGRLELRRSYRGRIKAIRGLCDIVESRLEADRSRTMIVGHADCLADAERLRDMLVEKSGVSDVMLCDIGPVIGAHTGPGMLAVAFWGV